MPESIIVALITAAVTLFGVLASNSKVQTETRVKMEELTREVKIGRAHV